MSQLSLGYDLRHQYSERVDLTARPFFHALFWGGPEGAPMLPPQVYGLGSEFGLEYRPRPRIGLQVGASPGVYSDFEEFDGAVRVPARAFVTYAWSERLVLVGGAAYTATPDAPVVPVAGAIWTPPGRVTFELILPRPRAIYKATERLSVYGGLEFFANAYTIRTAGRAEEFQYQDFRAAVGGEWNAPGGALLFAEAGVAFGRELEFEFQPDREVDPGAYVRVGGRF